MTLALKTRLGPYEVLSLLGAGGMGEVYAGRDVDLRRPAAIKVLPESVAGDPVRLARFEREAQLASSLNHPNIVTIYSIGRDGPIAYIAMELIEGRTLEASVAAAPWPIDRVLETAAQIASALAKAHDAGVVHRDLKPQNVMITHDGRVKLLDFGLSVLSPAGDLSEASAVTQLPLTKPGVVLGTVHYMSPEQAAGHPVDFRSDQFSFGSVLYELLTGRRPFERPSAVQTLSAIIEASPRAIAELNPRVPERIQAIVERCLSKRPEGRYASTQDLAWDLEAARDQLTSPRAGSWSSSRPAPPAARRWLWAAAAVAVVTIAAVSAIPAIRARLPWPLLPRVATPVPIAVLPFTNIGGDAGAQPFNDGLVEVLTSQLSQIARFDNALEVVPASDIRSERITSAREAHRMFRVSRVITGSIQHVAGAARVRINLVDADNLRQLDARSIDLRDQDAAAMQDGVVREVAAMMGASLPVEAQRVWAAGGTTRPGASEAYLKARGYLQRYDQLESVELAIAAFQAAIALDPNYALAHAGLGEAYWRKYESTKDAQWIAAARASCTAALGLADRLAPVHLTLGVIDAGTGRHEDAIRELRRAISLDPISADAYRELARVYQAEGRTAETEATYKTAIEVRPTYWENYNALGAFYIRRARYAEAETQFKHALEYAPDSTRVCNNLGGLYIMTKRYGDAAAMLEKSAAIRPTLGAYNNLGTVYWYLGRYGDAARQAERALTFNVADARLLKTLAAAYYWAPGERAKAGPMSERALAAFERELNVNPRSAPLLIGAAACHAMLGHGAQSRALIDRAIALAPDDVDVQVGAGQIYEQLGDRGRALTWVGKAMRNGYSRDLIDRSPDLAALRADSRFKLP